MCESLSFNLIKTGHINFFTNSNSIRSFHLQKWSEKSMFPVNYLRNSKYSWVAILHWRQHNNNKKGDEFGKETALDLFIIQWIISVFVWCNQGQLGKPPVRIADREGTSKNSRNWATAIQQNSKLRQISEYSSKFRFK